MRHELKTLKRIDTFVQMVGERATNYSGDGWIHRRAVDEETRQNRCVSAKRNYKKSKPESAIKR